VAAVVQTEMLMLQPLLVFQAVLVVVALKTALLVVLVVAEIHLQLLPHKEIVVVLDMAMVLLGAAEAVAVVQGLLVQTLQQVERLMVLVLVV